jgi:hypothetical protein
MFGMRENPNIGRGLQVHPPHYAFEMMKYMFIEWHYFKLIQKDFPCIKINWIDYMDLLFMMCADGGDDKPHINLAPENGYFIPSTKIWWWLKVWLECTKDPKVLRPQDCHHYV